MRAYLGGWNEYHALVAMCLGMVAHAATVLRSRRQAAGLAALVVLCLVPAWFLTEPAGRAFSLPLAWALCFGVGFGIAFRRSVLPLVTAAGVIHYLLLTYYALYLSARDAGVILPTSIVVAGLVPGAALALGSLAGLLGRPWFRTIAYVGYLSGMVLLVVAQNPSDYLRDEYVAGGFSLWLYVVAFLLGGVALAICSHLVQLLLLIPPWERASTRILFDAVFGPFTYHRDQARLMATRHLGGRIDAIGGGLLLAHGLLLGLNARGEWFSHPVVVSASLALLAWVVLPWEAARRLRDRPAGEEVSP